jgi:YesN/AraC family two-component response regulator
MSSNPNIQPLLDICVLYVEDEEIIQTAVHEFLSFRVRKIILARNGKEGLDAFMKETPDLVITDIKMPLMNGIVMSEEIRSLAPKIPIIITTAYNETEFLLSAREIGINDFLIKPLNLNKFSELLEKYAREKGV